MCCLYESGINDMVCLGQGLVSLFMLYGNIEPFMLYVCCKNMQAVDKKIRMKKLPGHHIVMHAKNNNKGTMMKSGGQKWLVMAVGNSCSFPLLRRGVRIYLGVVCGCTQISDREGWNKVRGIRSHPGRGIHKTNGSRRTSECADFLERRTWGRQVRLGVRHAPGFFFSFPIAHQCLKETREMARNECCRNVQLSYLQSG